MALGLDHGGQTPDCSSRSPRRDGHVYVGTALVAFDDCGFARLDAFAATLLTLDASASVPVRMNAVWLRPIVPVVVSHVGTHDRLRRATVIELLLYD